MLSTEERLARYRVVLDEAAHGGAHRAAAPTEALRQRRRLLPIAAAFLLVAGIGLALATTDRSATRQDGAATQPTGNAEAAPLGTWRAAAVPPFAVHARMQAEVTNDGRVIVLGPPPHGEEAAFEGGIYDPGADTWQVIPPAPLSDGGTFEVAGDVVVAVSDEARAGVRAAWLDLQTLQWTTIDVPAEVGTAVYPWVFDGETLVFVDTGKTAGTEPATLRWSLADQTWRDGQPFPLVPRQNPAAAKGSGRVAVWGGSTTGDPAVAATDGAMYDVASDSWTIIPDNPALSAMSESRPTALLHNSGLILVGGFNDNTPRETVSYDGTTWQVLPSPTAIGYMADGSAAQTAVVDSANDGVTHTVQYLDPATESWRDAPYPTLVPFHEDLLAFTAASANPGSGPFQVSLLTGGMWHPLDDAPFGNRMEPAIAVVGNLVIVVGGDEGSDLVRKQDAWILDLAR